MPNLYLDYLENFDQSEASILVMWLPMEASDWSKFEFEIDYRFGIFEQFSDHFTLGQILIRALFQYFFLQKPTIPAQLTNFLFQAFKERSIKVKSANRILKFDGSKKLQNPILKIWNAHISLVEAQIFTCNMTLQPYCQQLFEMVWHLKIGPKMRVWEPNLYFGDIFIKT